MFAVPLVVDSQDHIINIIAFRECFVYPSLRKRLNG